MGDELVRVNRLERADDDRRDNLFAVDRIGQTKDGRLGDGRMAEENLLDLAGIDVVAAGNDQLPRPTRDREVPVVTPPAQIAGVEPAVAVERLGRRVWPAPIALEHVWATHLDLAYAFVLDRRSGPGVDDPGFLPGKRLADGSRSSLADERIGEVHAGLGHA